LYLIYLKNAIEQLLSAQKAGLDLSEILPQKVAAQLKNWPQC
jgi:hypothetical protein